MRQVEAYFRDQKVAGGRFNHVRPATILLRDQVRLSPKLGAMTLTRAEQLFARLNDLLQ